MISLALLTDDVEIYNQTYVSDGEGGFSTALTLYKKTKGYFRTLMSEVRESDGNSVLEATGRVYLNNEQGLQLELSQVVKIKGSTYQVVRIDDFQGRYYALDVRQPK